MTDIVSRFFTFVALLNTVPFFVPDHDAPAYDPSTQNIANELTYELTLSVGRIRPDGIERDAVLVNNMMPGPLIKANLGDSLHINVVNHLDINNTNVWHPTSVHWHGIDQIKTSYNDGGAGVNQCPIVPNQAYKYNFQTYPQYGTFWYHSHYRTQYCDGLRGPLVIYNPKDPYRGQYDYDNENTIISLIDWYDDPARTFHRNADGIWPGPPKSNATLINGKGIRYLSEGKGHQELTTINVYRNKRYRMRLMNLSCDPSYNFTIEGHTLRVIEADSRLVKSNGLNIVDALNILPGQRYSFILVADQKPGNYWIRAQPSRASQSNPELMFNYNASSAILHYVNSHVRDKWPSKPSNAEPPDYENLIFLRESDLVPYYPEPVPGPIGIGNADVSIPLEAKLNLFNKSTNPTGDNTWSLGHQMFSAPKVPVLLQILSGARLAKDLLPQGAVYTLPPNKTVEITFQSGKFGPHPFHLHGHDFWVVKSADATKPKWTNAIRRDTVSSGESWQDGTVIRFRTDNPGPWYFHCHVDYHLEAGLGIVFAEDPDTTATDPRWKPTPEWDQLCIDYDKYLEAGGKD